MVDKNKGESVRDANPHDLRDHFEFALAIVVAMGNNCPTAEWRSWEDVPRNVNKAVMDEVLMSHLIITQRAITFTPSPTATPSPMITPTIAATAPIEMDHRPVNPVDLVGLSIPQMSQLGSTTNAYGPCRQLKTAKVTRVTNDHIPIGYDEQHWAAPTAEQHSALAHDIGHVVWTFCPMRRKSWKAMPEETKNMMRNQLSTNYNLEDMDEDMFAYLNRLFSERYKQWKSDLHQSKANKINREKKILLHHSGLKHFYYRMEARRKEGSKFPEFDIFAEVYVRPGDELTESLHVNVTNQCYRSRYEVPKFLSSILFVDVCQFPLMFLVYYANVWTTVALFRQVRWIHELERIAGLETVVRIEVKRRLLSLLEELKSAHAKQQASNATHEAKIIWYIDLTTVEEVKAKNYQEGFEKVRDELRLES
ncbi:hypothetical protein D8674_032430 [Pyrus ussuriensis x Pyrus communis]|uniref:Uncharacterized protein n=1 Tax=Pyrus ussuriensis x Pyrus communis TaxID=2448454 RepID=A0A5N5F798_9ROSA|nr:hypothetical protein D8674_032430 [Pyrus ussuriensis x Pyrus communis]